VALSKEGYSLNWLGKSYARLLANENIRTLLKADTAHNAKPANATSQNLLIKGDNLEVLKHLMGAYSEQVKMIYIDPPYNTGSDGFVYQDDRKFSVDQLSSLAGIDEDEAKRILEFTSSSSNSHSAWLTFMYPRLYLAKQLLRDDGVIFISIDDNEQAQLKVLCDEVFGEENCLGIVANINNPKGRSDDKFFATAHEYLIVYSRNKQLAKTNGFEPEDSIVKRYNKQDKDGEIFREIDLRKTGDSDRRIDRQDMFYYFYFDQHNDVFRVSKLQSKNDNEIEIIPLKEDGTHGRWRWGFDTAQKDIALLFPKFMPTRKIWGVFEKDYLVGRRAVKPTTAWTSKDVNSERGSEQFIELGFEKEIFPRPKPIGTIYRVTEIGTFSVGGSIILDFFAGSGTTAHAVMQLNAEHGGNRQFICVQIDEATDPKSEAYKSGYQTIFGITQARITKAAAKIQSEYPGFKGDLGFKMFETLPLFDKYLDSPDELTENLELFDVKTLSQADRHNLMLTWALRDGIRLGAPLAPVTLGDYTAYAADKTLYFVEPDISLDAVVALLEQLDNNPDFSPSRLVVLGYLLDSKAQREMTEAVKHYNNRKGIELSLDIRYN
jgi:adenine-specific DNA-methyltransferase